jgi:hypothetical protein
MISKKLLPLASLLSIGVASAQPLPPGLSNGGNLDCDVAVIHRPCLSIMEAQRNA